MTFRATAPRRLQDEHHDDACYQRVTKRFDVRGLRETSGGRTLPRACRCCRGRLGGMVAAHLTATFVANIWHRAYDAAVDIACSRVMGHQRTAWALNAAAL